MKNTCIQKGCGAFSFPYFEGWYLKHQKDGKTIAFIPAVHADKNGHWSVSLQVVTEEKVWYLTFPKEVCKIRREPLYIRIGNTIFSEKGVHLDIRGDGLRVKGDIRYSAFEGISYDIMGFFKYIPFLQCSHGVVSMQHCLRGQAAINGNRLCMTGGRGYVETDRGRSFPEKYIWTQSFLGKDGSIMLSVADIPLLGFHFTGCICVIHYGGLEYRMATYLGVRIEKYEDGCVIIRQGKLRLKVQCLKEASFGLRAPEKGVMKRMIKESPSCPVRYQFFKGREQIFDLVSKEASFEQ